MAIESTRDFGYRGCGPGFLAQLFTGNWGYSYVDSKGGDIIDYSRRCKHRLSEIPSRELIRAILFQALTTIEYALKDLATIGEIYSKPSNSISIKYTKKTLEEDLTWVFDEADDSAHKTGYTYEYCCEALNLDAESLRKWLYERICTAKRLADDIKLGKRKPKPRDIKRVQFNFSSNSDSLERFFDDLEAL